MRVLLVSHRFPPGHAAGTETYAAQLGDVLAQRGHEVRAFAAIKDIASREHTLRERVHGRVAVTEVVNNLCYTDFRQTWDEPRIERVFAELVARARPEVVHVHHLMYLSIGCVEIAARAGAVVVFTLHDFWMHCARFGQRLHADGSICESVDFARCGDCLARFKYRQTPLEAAVGRGLARVRSSLGVDLSAPARRVGRAWSGAAARTRGDPAAAAALASAAELRSRAFLERVVPRVARFVAPSRFLLERFVEWGLPREQVEYVPLALDARAFDPARRAREAGAGSAPLAVGFIGTLARHKGAHVLLDAWSRLPESLRSAARLGLFGPEPPDVEYGRELARLAARSGASLRGPLPRERVPEALAALDLLVVPSIWFENAPLVITEALAMRTPVLASDLGGMAELARPERGGERFRAGDAADLAAKLAGLVEDRERLTRLGRAAARPIDVADHAATIESIYAAARARLPCARP
jgi:glycosyltransferase involved in cell wall biosynthesis